MMDAATPSIIADAPADPSFEDVAAQVFGTDAPAEAPKEEPAKAAPEEPKPDPVAEKVAARIEIAKKVELRAAAAREEVRAARAEVDAKRAELDEMAKSVETFKAAKLSPSKALELLGMSPKEFLESLATEHEPSAIAARASQGAMGEVEKLRAELRAMQDAARDRDHQARVQENDSNYNAATAQFLEFVDTTPDKYPHLTAEYTPSELAQVARAAAEKHAPAYIAKFGEAPSDEILADYLEEQAAARVAALAERRARIGQKAQQPSQGVTSGVQSASQPDQGPSPRTLTSRAASEKAAVPPKWSQEAADEESLRILNAALKAG